MRSVSNLFHICACSSADAPDRNFTTTSQRSESAHPGAPSTTSGVVSSGYARVTRNFAGIQFSTSCPLAGVDGGPAVGRSLVFRLIEATSNSGPWPRRGETRTAAIAVPSATRTIGPPVARLDTASGRSVCGDLRWTCRACFARRGLREALPGLVRETGPASRGPAYVTVGSYYEPGA